MTTVANTKQTAHQRIVWLDYAKAIGIFFVVWGHMYNKVPYASPIAGVIGRHIYAFHMPLFFMLSGIVLGYQLPEKEEIDIAAEAKKRAHRLLAPYGFWCAVYLFMDCAGSAAHGNSILSTFVPFLYGALTGQMSPMWFLYTLFMVETVFLLIWKYLKSKGIETSISKWGGGTADNSSTHSGFGWRVQILPMRKLTLSVS